MSSNVLFEEVADIMVNEYENVGHGKMMSSPAILHNKKVFAFYFNDSMVFKFGKDYDIRSTGVSRHELLNPFKNKAPMANWYVIGHDDAGLWLELAEIAYQKIKKEGA